MSRALAVALALAAAPRPCLAHAEHYGQSSHLTVRPVGVAVELELTPGARVAAAFVRSIDADGDDSLSEREQQAFAARVASDLSLTLDGRRAPLRIERVFMPDVASIETGEAMAVLDAIAPIQLAPGAHRLCFTNRHAPLPSAWAVNVSSDTRAVMLSAPTRADEGRSLCAGFTLAAPPPVREPPRDRARTGVSLVVIALAAGAGALALRLRNRA